MRLVLAISILILDQFTNFFVVCDFKSAPTTVKAPENDTVLLPCYLETLSTDGHVFNRIRWIKDAEIIADSGPPRMIGPERFTLWPNGSLQVVSVRPEDTAEYTCEIIRPEPWSSIKQRHAIEVLQAPSVLPDPIGGFLQVKLGEEVRISCKPDGVPYPIITWFYQGKEIQLIDNREMLKFSADERHLGGEYRCLARNGVGEPASATITLNVIYPPEVSAAKSWMHTAPGFRAQLECNVLADPPATVKWLKGEMPILYSNRVVPMVDGNSKHVLLIRNATFSDFGIYTCRATNELGQSEGQIQLSGVANPGIFKEADQRDVNTKSSHKLIWEVDSYTPVIEYKLWFRRYRPRNDIRNTDWNTLTIPAEHSTSPVHSKSYTIGGLREKTIYEALLTSRNRYGWSKPSALLKFGTDGADFRELQQQHQLQVATPVQMKAFDEDGSEFDSDLPPQVLASSKAAAEISHTSYSMLCRAILYVFVCALCNKIFN